MCICLLLLDVQNLSLELLDDGTIIRGIHDWLWLMNQVHPIGLALE